MSSFADVTAFLPRVTVRDGRALEHALAGQTLFQPGVELQGAVVEAAFAATDPPLMRRLAERRIPYLVDPQTLRFASEGFLEIARIADLPHAPAEAVSPDMDAAAIDEVARGTLKFEARYGAADFLAPGVPLHDDRWADLNDRVLTAAARLNGTRVARKPLIALVAPGRGILLNPTSTLERLKDRAIDGIYVQPLRLSPTRDSVEKLVAYVRFLRAARDELQLPVVAGRVGAFGLVLEAVGITVFDSGLGQAEGFDLASLNSIRKGRGSRDGPHGSRRIYLRALRTTLSSRVAEVVLAEPGLRSRFACELACCRWRDQALLGERCREHYLRVRQDEVAQVARGPTRAMRLSRVHDQLVDARDLARVVTRTLRDREIEPPSFAHLDRWIAVVTTLSEMPAAA
jgi:hypothetical protein